MNTIIANQYTNFINSGGVPYLEYELSSGEFITVLVELREHGLLFSFDTDGLDVMFDGEIVFSESLGAFLLPFNSACINTDDSLDAMFECIDQNIREGFIYSNGMVEADNV